MRKNEILKNKSFGKLSCLSIGISDYPVETNFSKLKNSSNDAKEFLNVLHRFGEYFNVNKDKQLLITSKTKTRPSRGEILLALKKFARESEEDDRFIFYFSGHGQRILDKNNVYDQYLVPEDAYSDSDPNALVNLNDIKDLINTSVAKIKIVILDACFSGPNLNLKSGNKKGIISNNSLIDFFKNISASMIIASCADDETSYSHSPNPELSLFTNYLIESMNGDPKACDENGFLTIDSLYKNIYDNIVKRAKSYQHSQHPIKSGTILGECILADFSKILKSNLKIENSKNDEEIILSEDSSNNFYLTLIAEWEKNMLLDSWKEWTNMIFWSGDISLFKDVYNNLKKMQLYLLSRIWIEKYILIEKSFQNFSRVLNDFLLVFDHFSDTTDYNTYKTQRIYKIDEWNPERYHYLFDIWDFHSKILSDLGMELTRSVNYICDTIRIELIKSYRLDKGAVLVEAGPFSDFKYRIYRTEYSQEIKELNEPYSNLRNFSIERKNRDVYSDTSDKHINIYFDI